MRLEIRCGSSGLWRLSLIIPWFTFDQPPYLITRRRLRRKINHLTSARSKTSVCLYTALQLINLVDTLGQQSSFALAQFLQHLRSVFGRLSQPIAAPVSPSSRSSIMKRQPRAHGSQEPSDNPTKIHRPDASQTNNPPISIPPVIRPAKLHGRQFYESIGSPKIVLAPMVDQSEFVFHPHLIIST